VSALSFERVRKAVLDAGFEVFRAKDDTIQLAERVRSHLMDANVSVRFSAGDGHATIAFVVRAQHSDYPNDGDDELLARVRNAIASQARQRGFAESGASSRSICDPSDASRVLDTWHELTFSKTTSDLSVLVGDAQYALKISKCVP
jgi:hypothetical protein